MTLPRSLWLGAGAIGGLIATMVVLFIIQLGVMSQMNSRLETMRRDMGDTYETVAGLRRDLGALATQSPSFFRVGRRDLSVTAATLPAMRAQTQTLPFLVRLLEPVPNDLNGLLALLGSVQSGIGVLPELKQELVAMQGQLRPIGLIPGALGRLERSLDALPHMDRTLGRLARDIAGLLRDIHAIRREMSDVDKHVANLDRKSGGSLPPAVPPGVSRAARTQR